LFHFCSQCFRWSLYGTIVLICNTYALLLLCNKAVDFSLPFYCCCCFLHLVPVLCSSCSCISVVSKLLMIQLICSVCITNCFTTHCKRRLCCTSPLQLDVVLSEEQAAVISKAQGTGPKQHMSDCHVQDSRIGSFVTL
jgi:hypothetical protein